MSANRANAQRSTGPRSATGKAQSRLNAWKHGLAIPVSASPEWSCEVARLARLIAGETENNPGILDAAARVAEASISVIRVRQMKATFFDILFRNMSVVECGIEMFGKSLDRLDRYERRALSQRRTAIRALNEVRAAVRNDPSR
ncbi:hypothetical protein [Microvirga arabica]|uniref:hypothetical protein n=1 Tax=Microvirga arabica TaxID=1128671 RepID=UPI001939276D|nr:hypothetical protein [Microvirga arabica]MBM1171011.1 hypothetical protein [Microvirga arabica]